MDLNLLKKMLKTFCGESERLLFSVGIMVPALRSDMRRHIKSRDEIFHHIKSRGGYSGISRDHSDESRDHLDESHVLNILVIPPLPLNTQF